MAALAVTSASPLAAAVNVRRADAAVVGYEGSSWHAEEGLLHVDLAGATVYVARITADGTPALARPCRRCFDALADAGVRAVFFTVAPGIAGTERFQ